MSLTNAIQTPANPTGRRRDDEPAEGIPRDRWGRPKIAPPGGGNLRPYTRASTLGGVLEDQYNLGEWKKRVAVYGVVRRRDLILAAAAVPTWDGLEDKRRLADIAEQAMQHAEANAAATIGTALHALTERLDQGLEIPDVGEDRFALEAYAGLMANFTVHGMEQFVVCDDVEAAGTYDRLISPRRVMTAPDGARITPDDRLIDDLKTSSTADYFGIKFAVQTAIYGNGVPYSHSRGREQWPDGIAPRTDWGVIMHVPSGGSSATPYWVDLRRGWELAHLAVQVKAWRARKDLVVAAELPTEPMPDGLTTAGLRSLIEAVPAGPGARDECLRLWQAHESIWSPELTELVSRKLEAS